jgi:toxin ParE1/3/4
MPARTFWTLVVSGPAQRDIEEIAAWTARQFGARQAEKYVSAITRLLPKLEKNPIASPSRARNDVGLGYRTWHVARPGRHLLLCRIADQQVFIIRILHDSMDLPQHLPPPED